MSLRTLRSVPSRCRSSQLSEEDFRPAALLLQSRPSSPVGRLLMMELVALLVIAILWLLVSRVDIHAVAVGALVPVGQSKLIRAPRLGLVRELLVEEGDLVAAGQPLVALDAAEERSRLQQVVLEIGALERDERRLQALLASIDDGEVRSWQRAPEGLPVLERQELQAAFSSLQSQYEILLQRTQRQQSALRMAQSELDRLIARQPLIERSREAVGKLFDRNMAAEQEYIRVKLESIETTYAIEAAREAVLMHQAQIEETRREVESLLSSARRDWLAQLMQTRLRKAQLNLERGQLDLRIADLLLRAPVGGSVEELQIHAVDAVVDAAQPLMKLVPWPRAMEIEARLNDRDAGFVVAGHAAKIKVDAFPYTRFGTLQGVVSRIAAESATDESGTSSYRLRVTPSAESLARWSETASLLPGMRVSVEIRTGQRRLIEFFLSPILRYRDESLHER